MSASLHQSRHPRGVRRRSAKDTPSRKNPPAEAQGSESDEHRASRARTNRLLQRFSRFRAMSRASRRIGNSVLFLSYRGAHSLLWALRYARMCTVCVYLGLHMTSIDANGVRMCAGYLSACNREKDSPVVEVGHTLTQWENQVAKVPMPNLDGISLVIDSSPVKPD